MHASSKWLIGEIAIVILVSMPLAFGYEYPLLFPYQWHKALHIFGVVIFLGNIMVTAVWMLLAERTKEPAVMHFASKVVNWAAVLFTGPGVILVLSNGLILATQWGGIYRTSWITAALALFALSGIVWVGFLLRYQHRLIQLSKDSNESRDQLPKEFFQVLRRWYFWGIVATILPLISLVFMVVKPKLW